jgi:hypothetical protein
MKQVNESSIISEIGAVADTKRKLFGYQAVVVEVVSGQGVEGTIMYFPGVRAKELK